MHKLPSVQQKRGVVKLLAIGLFLAMLTVTGSAMAQHPGLYSYSVKFVCGAAKDESEHGIVRPGLYATEINILNYHFDREADIRKSVFLLVREGKAVGREPKIVHVSGTDGITLRPQTATMDDCQRISEITGVSVGPLTIGFLNIITPVELAVDAVYTTNGWNHFETAGSVDVERIEARRIDP